MSEGDVSLIRDEDVLRRMWQQTEDFSRKKEIRAHMYRLREERLRDLYSPEPGAAAKGCDFTSTQGHVKSFADQSFESMKSKEVRDAGSPPKEFTYSGQDLRELSNAGWNVESENRTTDDGHTHIKSVNANIEGSYDVEGGRGQFAAVDHNKQAVTEYDDGSTSLKRNENVSKTAAHEQVVRKTDDGTHFSSTTNTSTSTSKFEQTSSKRETVPFEINDDYDQHLQKSYNTNHDDEVVANRFTKTNINSQNLSTDYEHAELVSRKVEYPDENTKVIVETRCLPDGTRVTSTRREFRAPAVQTSHSEHRSQHSRTENKSSTYESSQKRSRFNETSSKFIQEDNENNKNDIVESQKIIDDYDFKKNKGDTYIFNNNDDYEDNAQRHRTNRNIDVTTNTRREKSTTDNYDNFQPRDENNKYTNSIRDVQERKNIIIRENVVEERKVEKSTNQTEYSQRKISNDLSPAHQAWASTLRSDTPTRPSTRATSPGSKTFKSSTSSLRSSVSPDKTFNKPTSRGGSPTKIDKHLHHSTIVEHYSTTDSSKTTDKNTIRYTSPERKPRDNYRPRSSISPEKTHTPQRSSISPEKKIKSERPKSPIKQNPKGTSPLRSSASPDRTPTSNLSRPRSSSPKSHSIIKNTENDSKYTSNHTKTTEKESYRQETYRAPSPSPERKPMKDKSMSPKPDSVKDKPTDKEPGYMRPTATSKPKLASPTEFRPSRSPETNIFETASNKIKKEHYKFIDEETKVYVRNDTEQHENKIQREQKSKTPERQSQKVPEDKKSRKYSPSPDKYCTPTNSENTDDVEPLRNDRRDRSPKSKTPVRNLSPQKNTRRNDSLPRDEQTIDFDNSPSPRRKISTTNDMTKTKIDVDDKHAQPFVEDNNNKSPKFKSPTTNLSPEKNTGPTRKPTVNTSNTDFKKSPSPSKYVSSTSDIKTQHDKHIFESEDITIRRKKDLDIKTETKPCDIQPLTEDQNDRSPKPRVPTRNLSPDKNIVSTQIPLTPRQDSKSPSPRRQISPSKDIRVPQDDNISKSVDTINKKDTDLPQRDQRKHESRSPQQTTKKSPRISVTPQKDLVNIKEKNFRDTAEFINYEKQTEEVNKKILKERPRQLITPSTSPTRKPKSNDQTPSSEHSSPTTSVSGFVYFGSPCVENKNITDVDNHKFDSSKKEEIDSYNELSTQITRSKIPYRSPSPEKRTPIKESLPRKSSLKKPTHPQISPTEKPPSSFLISPNLENKEYTEHKVTIKNYPDEKVKEVKPKPPFERRETYEERCRKILGMIDTDSSKSESIEKQEKPEANISSPSVSPCRSPSPDQQRFETSSYLNKEKELATDEREDQKITINLNTIYKQNNVTPLKDVSPSKKTTTEAQQISKTTIQTDDTDIKKTFKEKITSTDDTKIKSLDMKPKDHRSKLSPEKITINPQSSDSGILSDKPKAHPDEQTNNYVNKPCKEPKTSLRESLKRPESPTKQNKIQITSEYDIKHTTEKIYRDVKEDKIEEKTFQTKPLSPTQKVLKSSPTQQNDNYNTNSTLNLIEKEKEVMEKVQNSLRKLSPVRNQKPSDHNTTTKASYTLKDLDIAPKTVESDQLISTDLKEFISEDKTIEDVSDVQNIGTELKNQKVSSKPQSRNASPTKKVLNSSPIPTRSMSPKKPLSPTERPKSPQVTKTIKIKAKDQGSALRKPTLPSPTKVDKTVTPDTKKGLPSKQLNYVKPSLEKLVPSKIMQSSLHKNTDQEPKRTATPKSIRDNVKKDLDSKFVRTSSDTNLKSKKSTPVKNKSKPDIQVNDVSTARAIKQTTITKSPKFPKESQTKLPSSKPKSATALNTPIEDDDVIIDVQQAKSSRENSPDRICPTPVGFSEDVGVPRFPDEVNEPDDEIQRRTYQTIHETESLVDDIVEISEEDELFVKKTNVSDINETENYLLSVNDKASKFTNKIENVKKAKIPTESFKETERKIHSDFLDDKLKSDDCLLSVSEKVNKFARGKVDIKDNRSPSRNIADEYDKHTTYQDDYTKLSVNDKAHLFIETAENVKSSKPKSVSKVERPDLNDVDDELKKDDCLLSVSDKVNKFVKTAEQFLSETQETEEKEKKIIEEHEKIMKKIIGNIDDKRSNVPHENDETDNISTDKKPNHNVRQSSFVKDDELSTLKTKNVDSATQKPTDKSTAVKITTLRSSEAVKKAKALFENIASTTQKVKEPSHTNAPKSHTVLPKKTTKSEKSVTRPFVGEKVHDNESDNITVKVIDKKKKEDNTVNYENTSQHTSEYLRSKTPDSVRTKSPSRLITETTSVVNMCKDSPKQERPEKTDKSNDKVPGYQRATKTSQNKEEAKVVEDSEVSSRRGSGKFGVELRRTSTERSTASHERRRSSVEHHQPCIEDIYDVDLLEQMLEKVVGYEQRRRIRAQIRVAKKQSETSTVSKTKHTVTKTSKTKSPERHGIRSPDRKIPTEKYKSPERSAKSPLPKATSPERNVTAKPQITLSSTKDHEKVIETENSSTVREKQFRTHSPEKLSPKVSRNSKSPMRQPSPEKRHRPVSPTKTPISNAPKPKSNRFNDYASAYMKKVGINDTEKSKETKLKKTPIVEDLKTKRVKAEQITETQHSSSLSHKTTEVTCIKDVIEVIQVNGKSSPILENYSRDTRKESHTKYPSPERKVASPEPKSLVHGQKHRSPERSPSPIIKRQKSDINKSQSKKETIIKTVYDIEKKIPQKQKQEEKPSWVMNRNLKKVTSETRTFSSKKIEPEKPKYRAQSPSKAITKPIDAITSSYGPGPVDADGRPLFGIKALRNGASNYQVKGTVIRQEFHSRNGSEPEGTVSVTAYSTEPEDLERLLQAQGEKPSRLHGLAAITTTKKFGGDTGTTLSEAHNKDERAVLEQFTHSDRKVTESKIISGSSLDRRQQNYTQREKVQVIEIDEEDKTKSNIYENETTYKHNTKDLNRETTDKEIKYNKRTQNEGTEKRVDVDISKRGLEKTERSGRMEKRSDEKKTVRQSSVKSLTEKFIKNASETSKSERSAYPKAGLILRTSTMKDSASSDSSAHAGLTRTDSDHSLGSMDEVVTTTTTEQVDTGDGVRTTTTTTRTGSKTQERSFLDSSTKVTGVQDILTRMKNADIVIEEGDTSADSEARALLNKFLGATVLMAGMQSYVTEKPTGKVVIKETVQNSGGRASSRVVEEFDVDQCWDERVLKKLLDECTDYEQRRRLRARIRTLMAEQEACASAVTEALAAAGETVDAEEQSGERGESLLLPLLQGLLQGGGQRLLAGLGAASHDVVADVRRSLQRLRVALAPPNDHPQARALLALADRLEDALNAADRLDGCKRKTRRRSRTSRHTVGVTREELEEARRIVDRDQLLPEPIITHTSNTSSTPSRSTSEENASTPERKQSIDENITFHNPSEERQKSAPIAQHANFSSIAKVNRDYNVVERRVPNNRKPDFFRHSIADVKPEPPKSPAERWHSETKSSIAAIAQKFNSKVQKEAPNQPTIRRAPLNRPTVTIQQKSEEEVKHASFYRPPPPGYNFAAPLPADGLSKPLNRFSNNASKRIRMKRANTIDIGRPLGGYNFDMEDDENKPNQTPKVPEFQPQTENDRKFLAFMQKNENMNRSTTVGQANWSNRFGNIKNTFENRDREENIRASSASAAKRFWKTTNENSHASVPRPRKFLEDITPEIIKPPWSTTSQRRDSLRSQQIVPQLPAQSSFAPTSQPQIKQNVVKPFVAKPVPVNQFSHAPMSAFKPPQKITSPTSALPNVWSPPSTSIPLSPSVDYPPAYPLVLNPLSPSSSAANSFLLPDADKLKKMNPPTSNFENENQLKLVSQPKTYGFGYQPAPPTHVRPQAQNYPIKPIPSQNNLTAPELVKKLAEPKSAPSAESYTPKLDAQQLQIEFYERQIREKNRREASNERREVPLHKPPPPPAPSVYTIVDYTQQNVPSTFVPLQQTPDIEKAKAHKVDYLPDVVMNEFNTYECNPSPGSRMSPSTPSKRKVPQEHQNGDTKSFEDEKTTEHDSVVTRVMRGPVRGSATITTGIRTRHSEGAADNLRGVLDKLTSPKNEVISQIEKKKQEVSRNQVRLAAPPSIRPGLSPPQASLSPRPSQASEHDSYPRSPAGLRSPALAASRESVFSSESPASRGSSPSSALARSGSWHRFGDPDKAISPRRVVARTKSMHLLAIPKLFEGGISSEELPDKKRTVQAYFSKQTERQSSSRTSDPHALPARSRPFRSVQPQSFALGRSRTMPAVSELQFLDESNADDAFEDLVSALA